MAKYQPARPPPRGYWESGARPNLVLFAWPDALSHQNQAELAISNAAAAGCIAMTMAPIKGWTSIPACCRPWR